MTAGTTIASAQQAELQLHSAQAAGFETVAWRYIANDDPPRICPSLFPILIQRKERAILPCYFPHFLFALAFLAPAALWSPAHENHQGC